MDAAERWVVVTGISGSGRTTVLRALEDVGYYCVDNLPAGLLPALQARLGLRQPNKPVAVGVDARAGVLLDELCPVLAQMEQAGRRVALLFLDCADEALIRRFSVSRRKHPFLADGPILAAIHLERQAMQPIRARADLVLDTSELNVHQLKARVQGLYGQPTAGISMAVSLISFGFRHGVPREANYVFDARLLANPYFVPELKDLTGLDPAVQDYVLHQGGGADYLTHLRTLLEYALPRHEAEGRALVTVAVGCTGGRHRSVALVEALAATLRASAVASASIQHRDVQRENEGEA